MLDPTLGVALPDLHLAGLAEDEDGLPGRHPDTVVRGHRDRHDMPEVVPGPVVGDAHAPVFERFDDECEVAGLDGHRRSWRSWRAWLTGRLREEVGADRADPADELAHDGVRGSAAGHSRQRHREPEAVERELGRDVLARTSGRPSPTSSMRTSPAYASPRGDSKKGPSALTHWPSAKPS